MKTKYLAYLITVLFVLASFITITPNTNAATKEEIEIAIVKGLAWLASQQKLDGSWQLWEGDPVPDNDVATTGLAVLKFEERARELGKNPFDPNEYEYAGNVIKGLDYIFSNVIADANGVHFPFYLDVYNTGISMMAVAASNAPLRTITTGPLTGKTYKQALQGMMDWMVYAQNDEQCGIGGWGYIANEQDWADNSNSGYASIGIGFASEPPPRGFSLTIPASVPTGLNTFINNVQVASGAYMGGSIYNPCWTTPDPTWINILKTGNLLYELALVGADTSDARVQNAISFIQNYWNSLAGVYDGGGWMGDYQAMFAIMKGFEALGIQKIVVGSNEIDWFDVVSTYIVQHQDPAGFWASTEGETVGFKVIDTAWALLTLERVVPTIVKPVFIDIKPGSCPNPLNVKSKGVLPVAVLGTEDFDVSTIDPASIRLSREGVEGEIYPLRWSYEDVGTPFEGELCGCHALNGDGYTDLSLKFDTQALVSTLKLEEVIGNTLPLTLTGNLKEEFGGTPIKGQDCIWVLK